MIRKTVTKRSLQEPFASNGDLAYCGGSAPEENLQMLGFG